METTFMAYSDQIIKPLLLKYSKRGPVTLKTISEAHDIPVPTMRDSINRMLKHNQIARKGKGRKAGYRYYEPTNCQ
jgi:DNA-binding IscR family transcriptional regulator